MSLTDRRRAIAALWGLAVAVIAVLAALGPLPQDPAYHGFADRRAFGGIPNTLDVLSNLGFLLPGLWGLWFVLRQPAPAGGACETPFERVAWAIFFGGVTLLAAGSAYYHLWPSNDTLLWDRLPMTIAFMALLAVVVHERVSTRWGARLLGPALLLGIASVVYWHLSEQAGAGDLRPYVFVQFYPIAAIPLMLWLFPAAYTRGVDLIVAVGWYGLAKLCEAGDTGIFDLGGIVSGHTIKHLLAALAIGWILRMLLTRDRIGTA